jgi:isopentenyl phosphate kinase
MIISSEAMALSKELVFVKLGGSLITDKRRSGQARTDMIERLAAEILEVFRKDRPRLVLGHGSGSFGHVAAAKHGIQEGIHSPTQLLGVCETQDRAAALHRMLIGALRHRGVPAFSLAPSSFLVSSGGVPSELWIEALVGALRLGMLPVVYGDVVIDRELGASIASTEAVFLALALELPKRELLLQRSLWLGETDGVYDSRGQTIEELRLDSVEQVLAHMAEAAGTDVTGGMRLRLETAVRLASLGIDSCIANGLEPGVLGRFLDGHSVGGTWVRAVGRKTAGC